jgi:tripartite-type tricarboxylate transporter receptor subunit TctC
MLYAPAATPKDVVVTLNAELNKLVADPGLKERFASIGYDPTAISPEQAAAIMRRTGEAWAPLIKRLNIKLD